MDGDGEQERRRRAKHRCVGALVGAVVLLTGFVTITRHHDDFVTQATLVFTESPAIVKTSLDSGDAMPPIQRSPLARDSLKVVSDVFTRIYNTRDKRRELDAAGFAGALDVSNLSAVDGFVPYWGPALYITVRSPMPETAARSIRLVIDDVNYELRDRQAGYDPALSVGVLEVVMPTSPRVLSGSSIRALVAFAALAFLVAKCVSFVLGAFTSSHRPAASATGRPRGHGRPEQANGDSPARSRSHEPVGH